MVEVRKYTIQRVDYDDLELWLIWCMNVLFAFNRIHTSNYIKLHQTILKDR